MVQWLFSQIFFFLHRIVRHWFCEAHPWAHGRAQRPPRPHFWQVPVGSKTESEKVHLPIPGQVEAGTNGTSRAPGFFGVGGVDLSEFLERIYGRGLGPWTNF